MAPSALEAGGPASVAAGDRRFDVAIVGAGVVGSAIARRLTLRGASCVLIDAANDVGTGTSKANTALLHTGFDAEPGTLEAALLRRGHELLGSYAKRVGIPTQLTGALLIAWNSEELEQLEAIKAKASENGYQRARSIDPASAYMLEPSLGAGALGALEIPDEGILCPWTTTLALASEAVIAGCQLSLSTRVIGINEVGGFKLETTCGSIAAEYLVNAAGLQSDRIDSMAGHGGFKVIPRRGELIVFDKLARPLIDHILLPVPTEKSKGVLVAPTVYGNVLLGPTAEDVERRDDPSTTAAGLADVRRHAERILPRLLDYEVTATYAGLRAATDRRDYQIHIHQDQRYACVGGIRSTGISASMAIAEYVCDGLIASGLELADEETRVDLRMPNIGELGERPYESEELIDRDRDFGRIVCFCERVTRGEIAAALTGPIPPSDLDGLRRRTRALMGRCQGFFCGVEIAASLTDRPRGSEHSEERTAEEIRGR